MGEEHLHQFHNCDRSTSPSSMVYPKRFLLLSLSSVLFGISLNAPAHSALRQQRPAIDAQKVAPVPTGVYVYGQSPRHGEIGSEYLVFQVNDNQVVGGIYLPRSAFHCFSGQVQPRSLSIVIVDSYDQASYPYRISFTTETAAAREAVDNALQLEGYYRLRSMTPVDQRVLATCQAEY